MTTLIKLKFALAHKKAPGPTGSLIISSINSYYLLQAHKTISYKF